jgi:uncharacterized protein (DUF885 family)
MTYRALIRTAYVSAAIAVSIGATWADDTVSAGDPLRALMDDSWEYGLETEPLFATQVGDDRFNDRLPSVTAEDYERRLEANRGFLSRLREIDRDQLDREGQIDHDIFGRLLRDRITELEFGSHLMPITNRSGFHVAFPQLPRQVPLATVEDYENYIARLAAFREFATQHIALMRKGVEAGVVLPKVVLQDYDKVIGPHIVEQAADSLLFQPFADPPPTFSPEDRERLAKDGARAILESVVPGYRQFLQFMTEEYVPAGRDTVAASDLPDGGAFYEFRVRRFTTLDRTPEQVHGIGVAEVARIRDEMQEIISELEFEGEFADFLQFLRTDPEFYADDPDELMMQTAYVLKKMDGELPNLFGRLPRMPYGIRPVPDYIAPRTTTAYYNQPAGDGTRAGFYYVNLYNLPSRPLYEVEALSLHEAVPGHHLQIALQQELENLHPIRRFGGFTVFVEGWALYSESLGLETGFYEDPYSDFGRLTYEMWRACRLVVDTGIHALGWTRQRAIDFMAENSALSIHNITTEVDRYISWPGQALAYKTGQLEIRRLRSEAEARLGESFDVRRFHDVVLGSGAVPLDVLRDNVEREILNEGRLQIETAEAEGVADHRDRAQAHGGAGDHRTQ